MEVGELLEKTEFRAVKEGNSEGIVFDFNGGEKTVSVELLVPSLGEYDLYPKNLKEMNRFLLTIKCILAELSTMVQEDRGENPWQN